MSNEFPDDCQKCKKVKAEFATLLEGNEDWIKTESLYLCSECLNTPEIKARLIEAWTHKEWLECGGE